MMGRDFTALQHGGGLGSLGFPRWFFGGFSEAVFSALDGIGFAEPWVSALEGRLTFSCFAKKK
jgi:hypothetical protein